jgi:uncharacterized protein (TIGR02996 family)
MAKKKSTKLISRPEVIAFLRDAKENPDDDTTLLILADWLEDRSDPRGEFLRLDLKPADDEVFRERRDELLMLHREEWLGPLAGGARCEFHRGFVEVGAPRGTLLQSTWTALAGTELWEWVEELRLHWCEPGDFTGLATSPLLASISSLELVGIYMTGYVNTPLPARFVEALVGLLQDSVLASLRRLNLGCYWEHHSLELTRGIASSPALSQLRSLKLFHAQLSPLAVAHLATSPNLGNLTSLDLANRRTSNVGIGPSGVEHVVDSAFLERLRRLDLRGNVIQDEGVAILAASPFLSHIEDLDLSANQLTDAAVLSLTQSRHLHRLRKLDLSDNPLGPRSAQLLASCAGLSNLADLILFRTEIGSEGVALLKASPHLKRVRTN